jgi:plasmid stability protein
MGEMTIKGVDDAVLQELRSQADLHGMAPEVYARDLLRQALSLRRGNRAAAARDILAGQAQKAETESVAFIREDRRTSMRFVVVDEIANERRAEARWAT